MKKVAHLMKFKYLRTFVASKLRRYDLLPYIVDFRSAGGYHTFSNTDMRFAPNILGRACFFRMAPSVDGERAERLTITLLGAKDGGHHHRSAHRR